MRHPFPAVAVIATLLVSACTAVESSEADEVATASVVPSITASAEPTLDEVRRATERFRDVNVAVAEGYVRDPANECAVATHMGLAAEMGAMGVHYARFDLLEITAEQPRVDGTGTHTDFLQPAVLLYEPQADGSMKLAGVENLVYIAAWTAAGNAGPPSFQGVEWDLMADDPATELDEAHGFAPHYDRHVWLYRENPNGIYTQFNPAVSCAHHSAEHQQH